MEDAKRIVKALRKTVHVRISFGWERKGNKLLNKNTENRILEIFGISVIKLCSRGPKEHEAKMHA